MKTVAERIEERVRELGFPSFEEYLVARSDRNLCTMAEELGVDDGSFTAYHARWIDENYA